MAEPLPGRGIATNSMINKTPYLLNFSECSFWVLSRIFLRNLSKNFTCLREKSTTGPMRASINAAGSMLPLTANIKVVVVDNPISRPRGIANFSSTNGSIAAKNVISSGDRPICAFYVFCTFYLTLLFASGKVQFFNTTVVQKNYTTNCILFKTITQTVIFIIWVRFFYGFYVLVSIFFELWAFLGLDQMGYWL